MVFTKKDIIDQLCEMGAPGNSVVLMHTSLRAIGEVEGRGEGLLDLLIDYFTSQGGLFCVPTHTWANAGKSDVITLDMVSGETCIGTFPGIAARDKRAHRSLHPTHSMSVFGDKDKAEAFIKGEGTYGTPASPKGCYGRICDMDGYILLVGVGHDKDTYIHCVEEMLDVPNRLSAEPYKMTIRKATGEISEVLSRSHHAEGIGDVSARYPKYESAFRHYGVITDGYIGSARAQLCSARGIRDVVTLINKRSEGRELLLDFEPLDESLYM